MKVDDEQKEPKRKRGRGKGEREKAGVEGGRGDHMPVVASE